MKFLANENFPISSVRLLRNTGYDIVSIAEDMSGAKDQDVLARAHKEGRIILTFDKDYGELIYKQRLHTPVGIAFFRFGPSYPEESAEYLLGALEKSISLQNKFTVIEKGRIRQKHFPSKQ